MNRQAQGCKRTSYDLDIWTIKFNEVDQANFFIDSYCRKLTTFHVKR
jgi:hypothetical protein